LFLFIIWDIAPFVSWKTNFFLPKKIHIPIEMMLKYKDTPPILRV